MTDANSISDRPSPAADLLPLRKVAEARVIIIGLGWVGTTVFQQLLRHGVASKPPGNFTLIDAERVDPSDLIGGEHRLADIGNYRVDACATQASTIDPTASVSVWKKRLLPGDIPFLHRWVDQAQLLCCFTPDTALLAALSAAFHSVCPMVTVLPGPRCDYAEVAFSLPGKTPPLHISLSHRIGQPVQTGPALGCDVGYVAHFTACCCLSLLAGSANRDEPMRLFEDAPLMVVGLRCTWIFGNQRIDVVRSTLRVRVPPAREKTDLPPSIAAASSKVATVEAGSADTGGQAPSEKTDSE